LSRRPDAAGLKVLVVKLSSMGDIVHAQPLATDLAAHLPGATIDWVCEASFASIPALNPAVASVIPIRLRAWRRQWTAPATRDAVRAFLARLRAARYDLVIDCQGLVKSAVVARLARADHRAGLSWGSAREPVASWVYDRRVTVPWSLHVVERNRAVAAAAAGYRLEHPARFGLRAPPLRAPWLPPRGGYAVLIPGASRPQKLWPESDWLAVAAALAAHGLTLVWLWGSADERERVARLAAAGGDWLDASDPDVRSDRSDATDRQAPPPDGPEAPGAGAHRAVVPPFLTVAQAAGLLDGAAVVVGLDTGFTHLAGALGRPTVGIFCDFDPVQCAVTGAGRCESLGGVGVRPPATQVIDAIGPMLGSIDPSRSPAVAASQQ